MVIVDNDDQQPASVKCVAYIRYRIYANLLGAAVLFLVKKENKSVTLTEECSVQG